jgi:hypothetical protein
MGIVALLKKDGMARVQQVLAIRLAAIACVVAALALSAPVIWSAASAGAGLFALAVMAVAGTAVFQSIPLAMQVIEIYVLKARKHASAANPVEQLQRECIRREQRLVAFRTALGTIGGQIETLGQMIEERRHADPVHVLDRQARALERMSRFHAANVQRLDEAQAALETFRHHVQQKIFEWEFARSGEAVLAALNPGEFEDLVQDLLTDAALQSVQKRFNTVFSELDLQMRAIGSPTRPLLDAGSLERLGALGPVPLGTTGRRP